MASCTLIWPNLAPTWPQLGPNLASKMHLKLLKNYVKRQLARKSVFSTPLKRNASFCLSKGVPKLLKKHSKTTSYTHVVSTSKKYPPRTDFGPSWPPLGPPAVPPRCLQEASKASLKQLLEASWGILAASSIFEPPGGYPQAEFLPKFYKKSINFR